MFEGACAVKICESHEMREIRERPEVKSSKRLEGWQWRLEIERGMIVGTAGAQPPSITPRPAPGVARWREIDIVVTIRFAWDEAPLVNTR